jgi:hypothetical protein
VEGYNLCSCTMVPQRQVCKWVTQSMGCELSQ